MLNYIKSECYRITHTKQLYLFTGILAALAALFNGTLVYFSNRYTNTAFSYSNLVSQPMLFSAVGVLLFYILYEDSAKNGNIKIQSQAASQDRKYLQGHASPALLPPLLP